MTIAIAICAMLILPAIVLICWIQGRLASRKPQPKHARRAQHTHRRQVMIEDPRDHTDPDGTQFIAELTGGLPRRQRQLPEPTAVARFRQLPDRATLTVVLEKLRKLPPARPAAVRIDDTRPIPHAVGTWGMSAEQLAGQLAARHLEARR